MLSGLKWIAGPRYMITVILLGAVTISGLLLKTGMVHEWLTTMTSWPFVFVAFLIIGLLWFYKFFRRMPWGLIPLVSVIIGSYLFSMLWVA